MYRITASLVVSLLCWSAFGLAADPSPDGFRTTPANAGYGKIRASSECTHRRDAAWTRGEPPALPTASQKPDELNVTGDVTVDHFPPWQRGHNNDVAARGLEFTVPEADTLADFHGDPAHPALALYVGGNVFFAMAPLVAAFETRYPKYRGHLYWETIPPGLLLAQMKAGGTVTVGNMTWTVKPDVYLAGLRTVTAQVQTGTLAGPAVPYVTNTLTIMVPKGNPAHIGGLSDLGKPGVRLAMPNPAFEGIVRQIKASLRKAGGTALVDAVYGSKVRAGTTALTRIHHRQTPLWLMQGKVEAGVTWQSEAVFQIQAGHPIEQVRIPDGQNTPAIYAGATVSGAPHPEAARRWLDFVRSPEALAIFERYGFKPYIPGEAGRAAQ